MLPNPATSRSKPRTYFSSIPPPRPSSGPSQLFAQLRARTRLTNLAVSLILSALLGSLLLNAHYFVSSSPLGASYTSKKVASAPWAELASAEQLERGVPLSIETTIERDKRYADLDHMIMVPGHAIWLGNDPSRIMNDEEWILEPMQKGGSVKTFVKHIEESAALLRKDPKALLVFSGGATRHPPSPPMSEALSYLLLAQTLPLLPATLPSGSNTDFSLPLNLRAVTEEYALDSYENLLFSIARFHEVTGRWPEKVTVVGYGMKQRRFEQLHRHVIGFPADNFFYVGIDDEGDTTEHYAGELKYGYTPFLSSPSGCHPPLSTKRLLRNPYHRYHPYHTSSPQLADLLEWCPPLNLPDSGVPEDEQWKSIPVFPGALPWRTGASAGTRWGREKQ